MNRCAYIFLDEAGNFDFSPKGTYYFVLTSVSTRRPFAAHGPLDDYKHDCLEFGLDTEYFHCAQDNPRVRSRVFELIAGHLDQTGRAQRVQHFPHRHEVLLLMTRAAPEKNDPPDYSVAGESPLGSCHRGGTFSLQCSDSSCRKQAGRRLALVYRRGRSTTVTSQAKTAAPGNTRRRPPNGHSRSREERSTTRALDEAARQEGVA